jgi:Methyltransferase domain.
MQATTSAPHRRLDLLTNYSNPRSLGYRFRARRAGPIVKLIEQTFQRHGEVRILDVGGRKTYWDILPKDLLRKNRAHITLLNLPCDLQGQDDSIFTHATGNACDMHEFGDDSFHIVHSNSVIEHVGGWPQMKQFAQEVRRVAAHLYVQTPYYWFPVEPHYLTPFFHWMPKPFQVRLLRSFTLGNRGRATGLDDALTKLEDAPRMLDLKSFKLLFPDCRILKERFFLLTKSLIAVRGLG